MLKTLRHVILLWSITFIIQCNRQDNKSNKEKKIPVSLPSTKFFRSLEDALVGIAFFNGVFLILIICQEKL